MYKYYYIDCVVGGDKTGIINLKNLGRHKGKRNTVFIACILNFAYSDSVSQLIHFSVLGHILTDQRSLA